MTEKQTINLDTFANGRKTTICTISIFFDKVQVK